MSKYMNPAAALPAYLPYPRFLLGTNLSATACLLYALLLDRATLSQKNNLVDEQGRLYIIFPIERMAAALCKSRMTIKTALNELTKADLIKRKRIGLARPNHIYVKLPMEQDAGQHEREAQQKTSQKANGNSESTAVHHGDMPDAALPQSSSQPEESSVIPEVSESVRSEGKQCAAQEVSSDRCLQEQNQSFMELESCLSRGLLSCHQEDRNTAFSETETGPSGSLIFCPLTAEKPSVTGTKKDPSGGRKPFSVKDSSLSPNNLSINNQRDNHLKENQPMQTREERTRMGSYQNVLLTQEEYRELCSEIPFADHLVEELSGYMQSSGKAYADHVATLRRWASNSYGQQAAASPRYRDYSVREGDTV